MRSVALIFFSTCTNGRQNRQHTSALPWVTHSCATTASMKARKYLCVELRKLLGIVALGHITLEWLGQDQHATRGALGEACMAQLLLGWHIDVRDVPVLAHHWQRGDDINRGDVARNEAQSARQGRQNAKT